MSDRSGFLTRENVHFSIIACAFVFGIGTGFIHMLSPGGGALFWWPTDYVVMWVAGMLGLFVLLLVARITWLNAKFSALPYVIFGLGLAWAFCMLLVASTARVVVYPDRVERRFIAFSGIDDKIFSYNDVTKITVGCTVKSVRGNMMADIDYVLTFSNATTLDLTEGRNDGRDGGMWVKATDSADQALTAKGLKRDLQTGQSWRGTRKCLDELALGRTPEEMEIINRFFVAPDDGKKKRRS